MNLVRSLVRAVALLPLPFVSLGCGGSSSSSSSNSGPSPFNGTWSCTETTTYNYTTPAKTAPLKSTKQLQLLISIRDGDPLVVSSAPTDAAVVGDAGTGCSLTFSTSGASGTLEPNQSCTVSVQRLASSGNYTLDFTTGSASVSGNTLQASSTSTFTGSGSLAGGAVTIHYAGTGGGTTHCTK